MRQRVLCTYRTNPCDKNFNQVYLAYKQWLKAIGINLSRQIGMDVVDDLVNVGLLTISKSCKEFNYVCQYCRELFIDLSDLVSHCKDSHRIRGNCELVTLQKFVETSARLAMKRTAFRYQLPEISVEKPPFIALKEDDDSFLIRLMINSAQKRLTAEAFEILKQIINSSGSSKLPLKKDIRRELINLIL